LVSVKKIKVDAFNISDDENIDHEEYILKEPEINEVCHKSTEQIELERTNKQLLDELNARNEEIFQLRDVIKNHEPNFVYRVSDKHYLVLESKFLDNLQPGDIVMADRGFTLEKEFATVGAILKVPSFTKGKKQLSCEEVEVSRNISNLRIHVERVIGRLKNFRILQTIVPISQVDMLDDLMTVIAGIININESIIN